MLLNLNNNNQTTPLLDGSSSAETELTASSNTQEILDATQLPQVIVDIIHDYARHDYPRELELFKYYRKQYRKQYRLGSSTPDEIEAFYAIFINEDSPDHLKTLKLLQELTSFADYESEASSYRRAFCFWGWPSLLMTITAMVLTGMYVEQPFFLILSLFIVMLIGVVAHT